MAQVVFVSGTGTNIGKTYLVVSLLMQLRARGVVAYGYKPVESGATGDTGPDQQALAAASAVLRSRPPVQDARRGPIAHYAFAAPLSPHRAAMLEGAHVDIAHIVDSIAQLAPRCALLIVELPGGLFSPLTTDVCGADLYRMTAQRFMAHGAAAQADGQGAHNCELLLVAPNRLGVLHDVASVRRALGFSLGIATPAQFRVALVDCVESAEPDLSCDTNAADLVACGVNQVIVIPRLAVEKLATCTQVEALASALLGDTPPG
jgi:dethiobiotin synthetase